MPTPMRLSLVIVGLVFLANRPAAGQERPDSLVIRAEGRAHVLRRPELDALRPRDTVRVQFHEGAAVVYEGPSLAAVLRAAGVQTDSLRGPALATRLVVVASDGYRIVLALADLDPTLGARRVLLADRMDGKQLPADEGPFRLIVAGEPRPSRSARQVTTVWVLAEQR